MNGKRKSTKVTNDNIQISYMIAALSVIFLIIFLSPFLSVTTNAVISSLPVRIQGNLPAMNENVQKDQKTMEAIWAIAQNTQMYKENVKFLDQQNIGGSLPVTQTYSKEKTPITYPALLPGGYLKDTAGKGLIESKGPHRLYGSNHLVLAPGVFCVAPGLPLLSGSGHGGGVAATLRRSAKLEVDKFIVNGTSIPSQLEGMISTRLALGQTRTGRVSSGFFSEPFKKWYRDKIQDKAGFYYQDDGSGIYDGGAVKIGNFQWYGNVLADGSPITKEGIVDEAVKDTLADLRRDGIFSQGNLNKVFKRINGAFPHQDLYRYGGNVVGTSNGVLFNTRGGVSSVSPSDVDKMKVAFALGSHRNYPEETYVYPGPLQYVVWNSGFVGGSNKKPSSRGQALMNDVSGFEFYWRRLLATNSSAKTKDGSFTFKWEEVKGQSQNASNIKYRPTLKAGNGANSLDEAKKLKFNANTQKWLMGPFKLDYVFEGLYSGSPGRSTYFNNVDLKTGLRTNGAKNVRFKQIFAGLVKADIYGRYIQDPKAGPVNSSSKSSESQWRPTDYTEFKEAMSKIQIAAPKVDGLENIYDKYEKEKYEFNNGQEVKQAFVENVDVAIQPLDVNAKKNLAEVSNSLADKLNINAFDPGQSYLSVKIPGLENLVFQVTSVGINPDENKDEIALYISEENYQRYNLKNFNSKTSVYRIKNEAVNEAVKDLVNNENKATAADNQVKVENQKVLTQEYNKKVQQQAKADESKNGGKSTVKAWDFVMEKDPRYASTDKYLFPLPDQTFYIAINYDPALYSVDKMVFEFAYTDASVSYKKYTGVYNTMTISNSNYQILANWKYIYPYEDKYVTDKQVLDWAVADGIIPENIALLDRARAIMALSNKEVRGFSRTAPNSSYPWHKRIGRPDPRGNYIYNIRPSVGMDVRVTAHQGQDQAYIEGGYFIKKVRLTVEINNKPGGVSPAGDGFKYFLPLAGRAWEDKIDTEKKHTGFDNILGSNEKGIMGLRVHITRNFVKLDKNGNVEKVLSNSVARLYNQKSQEYVNLKIFTNQDGKWGPYYVKDYGFNAQELRTVGKNYNGYAIIFNVTYDYDGIVYENVIPLSGLMNGNPNNLYRNGQLVYNSLSTDQKAKIQNQSLALENRAQRILFNRKHAEIAGIKPEQNMQTTGVAKSVNNDGKFDGKGTTLNYKGTLKTDSPTTGEVRRFQSEYKPNLPLEIKADPYRENGKYYQDFMQASTFNLGVRIFNERQITFDTRGFTIKKPLETKAGFDNDLINKLNQNRQYQNINNAYLNLNLGLKKRSVDVGLMKDLNNAVAIVNKKATNYMYETNFGKDTSYLDYALPGDDLNTITIDDIQKEADPKKVQKYLDIYKTDYIYRTSMYSSNKFVKEAMDEEMKQELSKDPMSKSGNHGKDPRQLDVFLTYKVTLRNDSLLDAVAFTQIDDYYDSKLEQVTQTVVKEVANTPNNIEKDGINPEGNDVKFLPSRYVKVAKGNILSKDVRLEQAQVQNWAKEKDVAGYTKGVTVNSDLEKTIVLLPGEGAEIYTTYRVKNQDSLNQIDSKFLGNMKDLKNDKDVRLLNALSLGDFTNIAEVGSFASYDCLTGYLSGKIDKDSAPGNFNINKTQGKFYMEDDTDKASGITIKIPDNGADRIRTLEGTVFEDKKTTKTLEMATGDGIKDNNEKGIPNQVLVLEERISVKANNPIVKDNINLRYSQALRANSSYIDIPFVWPDQIDKEDIKMNLPKVTGFTSVVKTDGNGKYKYTGIPAGNFVVQMNYSSPSVETVKKIYETPENHGKNMYNAVAQLRLAGDKKAEIKPDDLVRTVEDLGVKRTIKYYNGLDFKNTTFYPTNKLDNAVNTVWISKDKDQGENKDKKQSFLRDDPMARAEITANNANANNLELNIVGVFRKLKLDPKENKKLYDQYIKDLQKAHMKTSQIGTTPKMNFAIEYYEKQGSFKENINTKIAELQDLYAVKGNYEQGGKSHTPIVGYDVKNINLGIVERPQTKVILNKEVKEINLRTADGKEPIKLVFTPKVKIDNNLSKDVFYGKQDQYNIEFSRELDKEKSVGLGVTQNLDRSNTKDGQKGDKLSTEPLKQGFRYLNIDTRLMQDTSLYIKYDIYAFNLSEMDYKLDWGFYGIIDPKNRNIYREQAIYTGSNVQSGKLQYNTDPSTYGYGRILGEQYYRILEGKGSDRTEVAKVKSVKVLDYADNSATIKLDDKDNREWTSATKKDLVGFVQGIRTVQDAEKAKFVDVNGEEYIVTDKDKTLRSNVLLTTPTLDSIDSVADGYKDFGKIVKLNPEENAKSDKKYFKHWTIRLDRTISTQTTQTNMSFENMAEIVEYKIESGKPDTTTPGNLITDLDIEVGNGDGVLPGQFLNPKVQRNQVEFKPETIYLSALKEHDQSSTELVTMSAPTGRTNMQQVIDTLIQIGLSTAIAVTVVTVIVKLSRKKANVSNIEDITTTK